jgi:20S proteasome subunit alpha 1
MILVSYDQIDGAQLFRVDPAGYYRGMRGVGVGVKQQPANSFFEKKFKKRTDYNEQETIEMALECLQTSLGNDIKAGEVEVVVVSKNDPNFRKLTNDEVDQRLNAIAERD